MHIKISLNPVAEQCKMTYSIFGQLVINVNQTHDVSKSMIIEKINDTMRLIDFKKCYSM